jgi:HSP20 family protein
MLAKRNFFDELLGLNRQFDSEVKDFLDAVGSGCWMPVVDVYEDPEKVTVEAELPGVDPENVQITIDKDRLTIKGSTTSEKTEEKKDFLRAERTRGSFMRSFMLPSSVESEKILASYDKGVLTVSIPKRPEEVPRKVDIKISR